MRLHLLNVDAAAKSTRALCCPDEDAIHVRIARSGGDDGGKAHPRLAVKGVYGRNIKDDLRNAVTDFSGDGHGVQFPAVSAAMRARASVSMEVMRSAQLGKSFSRPATTPVAIRPCSASPDTTARWIIIGAAAAIMA